MADREEIATMEAEVLPALGAIQQMTAGEIDVQIATAKRYPRSIVTFKKKAMEMATLDEETAGACFYVVPRGGKNVEGPSARLAEIIASAWGHMRIEARQIGEDDRFVTARGTAWDLENNVAIAFEVKRRITDRVGKRYNDDMIGTTSNAAASIALRNAVFKVVPSAFTREIYHKCREVAVGNAQTLADRRAKMLEYFQKLGVAQPRVFALLQVNGIEDITLDHMATLKGLATAIKEGDTSVDEAFADAPASVGEIPVLVAVPDALRAEIQAAFATIKAAPARQRVLVNQHLAADGDQRPIEERAQALLKEIRSIATAAGSAPPQSNEKKPAVTGDSPANQPPSGATTARTQIPFDAGEGPAPAKSLFTGFKSAEEHQAAAAPKKPAIDSSF